MQILAVIVLRYRSDVRLELNVLPPLIKQIERILRETRRAIIQSRAKYRPVQIEVSLKRGKAVLYLAVIRHAGSIAHPNAFSGDYFERILGRSVMNESAVISNHSSTGIRKIWKKDRVQLRDGVTLLGRQCHVNQFPVL
jgi:hypothetical protein